MKFGMDNTQELESYQEDLISNTQTINEESSQLKSNN